MGGYGITWNDELDLDAETLWDDGILIEIQRPKNINHILAYQLLHAREEAKLIQKELAEKTGIYQADISKIEKGIGNPSILTLKRLTDGLDMDLVLDFSKMTTAIKEYIVPQTNFKDRYKIKFLLYRNFKFCICPFFTILKLI